MSFRGEGEELPGAVGEPEAMGLVAVSLAAVSDRRAEPPGVLAGGVELPGMVAGGGEAPGVLVISVVGLTFHVCPKSRH